MSAEQPSLRDRIAGAIASVTITIGPNSLALLKAGNTLGLTGGEIDAMALSALAIVEPELAQLRAELDDLHGRLNDIESLCDHAESDALATWQDPQPVPQWATDIRAICRREPARTGCPDPIECDHEAEAGQLREQLAAVGEQIARAIEQTPVTVNGGTYPMQTADAVAEALTAAARIARAAVSAPRDDCGCKSATHPGHYPSCPTRADAVTAPTD